MILLMELLKLISKKKNKFDIYNLGNGKKVSLMKYISIIEKNLV